MRRKRICDCAVEILRETDNPAVGYGDSYLLHDIAERAGKPHRGWRTEKAILDALSRTPGILEKRYFRAWRNIARIFYLPGTFGSPGPLI